MHLRMRISSFATGIVSVSRGTPRTGGSPNPTDNTVPVSAASTQLCVTIPVALKANITAAFKVRLSFLLSLLLLVK